MYSPTKKVAILLVSLGEDLAASLLRQMQPAEAGRILSEMATLKQIDQAPVCSIVDEFADLLQKQSDSRPSYSPRETAVRLIEKSMGHQAAGDFAKNLTAELPQSFRLIEAVDSKNLAAFISEERPVTAAAILANISPKKAGQLLALFHRDFQLQVVIAIARLQPIDSELLHEIDSVLKTAIRRLERSGSKSSGGVKKAADILAQLGQSQGQQILENLASSAEHLAQEIKGAMFTFEDLQKLDNRGLELLVRKIAQQNLEIALRKASPDLVQRILGSMSQRLSKQIKDNLTVTKPVQLSLVEEKQREIIKLAQSLIAAGEIQDPAAEAV